MLLSELVDAFKEKYKLECFKREMPERVLPEKFIALIFSETVSDLQKRLGILESTKTVSSIQGINSYKISSALMTCKNVTYGGFPLERITSEDIAALPAVSSQPTQYAIHCLDNNSYLLLYPTPITSGDTISILANLDLALFSPSITAVQDFGRFDGTKFLDSTVLPTQYDRAIILGMLGQIIEPIKADYEKEVSMLNVKKYSAIKLPYKMN